MNKPQVTSQQYADLANHAYNPPTPEELRRGVSLGETTYQVVAHIDRPSGYQGTIYHHLESNTFIVAHRGTEFDKQPVQDLLLTDGGMLMARSNRQAQDAIELTRHAIERAQRIGREPGKQAPEVTVTGHSLGGSLAQITAHHFDLRGETFNAYGAAHLDRRIPEGGHSVLNHVIATDVVSAAAPHFGQVRVYALADDLQRLHTLGDYDATRSAWTDLRSPALPAMEAVSAAHRMPAVTDDFAVFPAFALTAAR